MASVYERITNAISSLGKRKERDSGSQDGGRNSAAGGGARDGKRFRPWEQSDLHRRLETFKPLTWFSKPDSVGAVPCALKGWVNDGCESLTCEHCGAKLVYPSQVPYDQRHAAADMFAPSLTSKHTASCPWRQTQCNESLLAYNPGNNTHDDLCNLFQALQNKLLRVDVLPDLDAIAIQAVRDKSTPYGSYDNIVLGGGGGASGALMPRRRQTPQVRIRDITDGGDGGSFSDAGGLRSQSSGSFSGLGGDPAASETYIIQPSKLTPQQKARLLALLGWDVEVLQPDTASGSAAAPYTQSSGYGLAHLGIKPKKPPTPPPGSAAGSAAASGGADTTTRYPMSSVVLKCPCCNNRMGLWNFAGVRPVPTGRLTPGQPATGAAALLSPKVGEGGAGGAGSDPLSVTIAGGNYALHGLTASGVKPFGAASRAPFRFGSGSAAAPVFGTAALDASVLGGGGLGFGSPMPSSAPKLLTAGPTTTATPTAGLAAAAGSNVVRTPAGGATPGATTPLPPRPSTGAGALTGHKRKASEAGVPEPMALDGPGFMSPGVTASGHDGKRQRLASTPTLGSTPTAAAGAGRATPTAGRTPTAGAAETQLRELDPLNQHKEWCPWVYNGTAENPHKSGWQHMLTALTAQQQQQAAAAAATPMATDAPLPAGGVTPVDARQLRDSALAAIRSL